MHRRDAGGAEKTRGNLHNKSALSLSAPPRLCVKKDFSNSL
jgi:hypothetical protein